MLIKCSECELQVSSKALACPHCGNPINDSTITVKKYNKRKRLPNGFGQITELKRPDMRNRFRAMVTVGKTSTGRPICKLLKPVSYFKSYNDAYAALVEYNKNPFDLDKDITVLELYNEWSKEYFKELKSPASIRTITSAWSKCANIIADVRAKQLRSYHIKKCMEATDSPFIQSRIKSVFNLMLDYANERDIVEKNYARTFNISDKILDDMKKAKNEHISFSDEEMEILWRNQENITVAIILFQCYTGWRPQEIGLLETKNCNLVSNTLKGGMKTPAGTDRIVPIHRRVRPIVERFYNQAIRAGKNLLISCTDSCTHRNSDKLTYDKYKYRFNKVINELGLNPNHRPHDPRKQFVTMAKKYNVNEYAIKRIIGHQISDLTENTYTDRDEKWLYEEINKIE